MDDQNVVGVLIMSGGLATERLALLSVFFFVFRGLLAVSLSLSICLCVCSFFYFVAWVETTRILFVIIK